MNYFQQHIITTFLAQSLPKRHESALSNVILYPLYTYFSLSLFFTIIVARNKQLLNLKLFVGFLGQASKSYKCEHLQFGRLTALFWSIFRTKKLFSTKVVKVSLSNFIPFLYLESFMLCKKIVFKGLGLELNTHFDFQLRTESVPLSVLNSNVSSVGW